MTLFHETLIREILETLPARVRTSSVHGEVHWRQVAQCGWYLADADPRVDHRVLFLFALLHDAARQDDGADPQHGRRAARLWEALEPVFPGVDGISLWTALCDHHGGAPSKDPTVGACFDADRLTLWRCGIRPDPARLSTSYARLWPVRSWAQRLTSRFQRVALETLSWHKLLEAYSTLDSSRNPNGQPRQFLDVPEPKPLFERRDWEEQSKLFEDDWDDLVDAAPPCDLCGADWDEDAYGRCFSCGHDPENEWADLESEILEDRGYRPWR